MEFDLIFFGRKKFESLKFKIKTDWKKKVWEKFKNINKKKNSLVFPSLSSPRL